MKPPTHQLRTIVSRRRGLTAVAAAAAVVVCALALSAVAADREAPLRFTDAPAQTATFIGYARSIQLSAEQEAIKKEALSALPAPCCSDNTAYTCCCPCNMALSIWGLSNWLIAEQGYDAGAVRAKVEEWVAFINPRGFSGNVCYTGGCGRPFADNGCGGMRAGHVPW